MKNFTYLKKKEKQLVNKRNILKLNFANGPYSIKK